MLARLRVRSTAFREMLTEAGYRPLDGEAAIIPIIVGETAEAIALSERLLEEGVFVTGFGFPVVPEGTARIRVQMSAALEPEHLERAIDAFRRVRPSEPTPRGRRGRRFSSSRRPLFEVFALSVIPSGTSGAGARRGFVYAPCSPCSSQRRSWDARLEARCERRLSGSCWHPPASRT